MSDDILEAPPAPRDNPYFLGHDGAVRALLDAHTGGRMAHAWLLQGPRGIGKATLAYRFARHILSQSAGEATEAGDLFADGGAAEVPDDMSMDREHPVFRRVAAGGHADLMVLERVPDDKGKMRAEIVVTNVRGVNGFLRMTAAEGGWRVVIVDCADDMNRNAANALLKVLEEPPAQALLLLVSHNPGRLLPTIRSRCRRLVMAPLVADDMNRLLSHYRPDLDSEDALALAHLADGSVGRALALADAGGLDLYQDVHQLLETLPGIDVVRLHALADRVGKVGAEEVFRTVVDLLQWWLARLVRIAAGRVSESDVSAAEQALIARLTERAGLDRWLEVWEKTNNLLARAGGANLERRQVFLNAVLDLEDTARG